MARILHVENESEWIGVTRRALADHDVDSASTYEDALVLIRNNEPYDLALVDLNLEMSDDRLGGEILDLLKAEYPDTPLILVTGNLPSGGLRDNVLNRYGVEDVIIKGTTTLPGLRRAVAAALAISVRKRTPQEADEREPEVVSRYRDWSGHLEALIQSKIAEAQYAHYNARALPGGFTGRTSNTLKRWQLLRDSFKNECAKLELMLADVKGAKDAASAMSRLDQVEATFAADISSIEQGRDLSSPRDAL
jgi:CheY-like chemotaxis protein